MTFNKRNSTSTENYNSKLIFCGEFGREDGREASPSLDETLTLVTVSVLVVSALL